MCEWLALDAVREDADQTTPAVRTPSLGSPRVVSRSRRLRRPPDAATDGGPELPSKSPSLASSGVALPDLWSPRCPSGPRGCRRA